MNTHQERSQSPAQSQVLPLQEADEPQFRNWRCEVCGFRYSEQVGLPNEGIPPGTRWEDVPDDWSCPDCGIEKSYFQRVQV